MVAQPAIPFSDPFNSEPPLPLQIEQIIPEENSIVRELFSIEIHFTKPVLGVDASDLLINGEGATNVYEAEPGQFLFSFAPPADGAVSIAWRAGHGITDAMDTNSVFSGSGWFYQLDTRSSAPGLLVTEFMTDNRRTLKDEDGDFSDWIEIFNSAQTDAPLLDWALTDSASHLMKWRFPDITLPARSYLLVYASAKNKTNISSRLHTNFKLASEGGFLALVSPDSHLVSIFTNYPSQPPDTSYGRVEGEPQFTGYFSRPTPGDQNAYQGPEFSPEVEFSRSGGTFTQSFALALSLPGLPGVIRYTLDGSIPTNSSPIYTAPIVITNSIQVRARTYAANLLPGPLRSEAYILLNTNLHSFTSDLPVLVFHALGKGTPTSSRSTFAQLSVFEPVQGITSLTNPPTMTMRTGVQIRGSSTSGFAKSSYKLELRDEFDLDLDVPLLGLPEDSDWVLYAPNQFEPVLIHNPFIHQLSRDMNFYSPRTRFVELYFNKSTGSLSSTHYAGIYVLEEKIKIGPNRVNIDKLQPENVQPPEVSGGYLFKFDRLDPGDTGLTAAGASAAYVDPKEREIKTLQRRPQQTYLQNFFSAFGKALSSANWRDPQVGYPAFIEVDNWIDFHVLEVLSGNVDALRLSTYFHKPRNGKIRFGPHWDFDRALGSTDGRDNNPRTWNTGPFFSPPWWNKVFTDKDFWQKWVDRWQELRQNQFSLIYINMLIDRLADEVRQAQPRERQKWRITLRGGSYQAEVDRMKNWLSNRIDFIDKQLTQPPRFNAADAVVPPGFTVTLEGPPNAKLYYTTDGSDPRAPQGGISVKASLYSVPIVIQSNTRLTARAYDSSKRQSGGPPISSSTPWSSPTAQTYVVNPIPLVISEIMFHPSFSGGGSATNESDFEYIELLNRGVQTINLAGFQVRGGAQFTFPASSPVLPPGQRLLLVRNRAAFLSRYPARTNLAGEFAGELRNSGDQLILSGPLREPILDFVYQDHWSPLADGLGFSLVLAGESNPASYFNLPECWRSSALAGGSPGEPEPDRPPLPRVYINEVVANPEPGQQDSIELLNDESVPADISGWFLTDDYQKPGKFRFPNGTVLPAEGPWLLDQATLEQGSGGFALSALGESIYIFSANPQGELTGWCHGFEFNAQEAGQSWGRWSTHEGNEFFAPYPVPSLGLSNPPPAHGPVIISEIMSEPTSLEGIDNTRDEFVELTDLSATDTPFPLHDPSSPTNTWRIRGAVDYDFPAHFRFPPNRRVVVVGFDPQRHTNALAGFRARYRLGADTLLVGPWQGSLSNLGGVVRLLQPLRTTSALVPYALVEQVAYGIQNPRLPLPARTGQSLSRIPEASFAGTPGQWIALGATPGDEDEDEDSLPDQWEISHGLNPRSADTIQGAGGDADHDGFTNLQEFMAGTSPLEASSYPLLRAASDSQHRLVLTFQMGPSRTYSLYSRDYLTGAPWRLMKTVIAPPEGGQAILIDSFTSISRYFRLDVQ